MAARSPRLPARRPAETESEWEARVAKSARMAASGIAGSNAAWLADRKLEGTEVGMALLAACLPRDRDPELCANLLAECSAEDLRATTMYKDSAFIYAANSGMVSLLEAFVEKGQDINVTDDEGSTALHSAVLNNEPDSVRELLRLGIDTTIKTNLPADPEDEPAMTALELAEGGGFDGSEEMVAILKRGW